MKDKGKMIIGVGSTNPVKVGAVEKVFRQAFGEVLVIPVELSSGVSEQPVGESETMQGAENRARGGYKQSGGKFGVGIEGGVVKIDNKLYECAWVAVVNESTIGFGGGLYFELPEQISQKILEGGELGPIMDEMTGKRDVKRKMGAIGIFSKGNLDRKTAYEQIIWGALIKFLSPEWFS